MTKTVRYKWWGVDKDEDCLLIIEYLTKVEALICDPVDQMQELNGDLFVSEYQKLIEGSDRLRYLMKQMKGDKK